MNEIEKPEFSVDLKAQKVEAFDEIIKLRKLVAHHNELYYGSDSPEITDGEFDKLLLRLEELETQFPSLKEEDSPAEIVGGGTLVEGFSKREHMFPLLSLEKAYSIEELGQWEVRLKKLTQFDDETAEISEVDSKPVADEVSSKAMANDSSTAYVCEPKLDGLSMALTYKDGNLESAVTRGDGRTGEDVTANMKMVEGVPLALKDTPSYLTDDSYFVVRGEVVMPRSEFERLNKIAQEEDGKLFANPRNAAAGTIRQLSSAVVAERKLQCICYDILGRNRGSHFDGLSELKRLGFITNPLSKKCDMNGISDYIDFIGAKRSELEVDIDGVVIKVDDLLTREIAGFTHKFPRWAISYKYQAERKETVLNDVVWQVGRTGVITPVAILEPIDLSGSKVSRASLHNYDEIKRKKIRKGVRVLVEKAGEIIPQIVKVSGPALDGSLGTEVLPPEGCPSCGGGLTSKEGEVALRCNNHNCSVQVERRLEHFLGKGALDAEGFGPSVVSQLVSLNLVSTYGDLFRLTTDDFLKLKETKETLAEKLYKSVQSRLSVPFHRFIMALGINFVGTRTAELLSHKFVTVEKLMNANVEEMISIDGVGEKTGQAIVSFFQSQRNREEVESLTEAGFLVVSEKTEEVTDSMFSGKTVVITGSFDKFGRRELTGLLKKLGAKCTGSVSKKTDMVIAGEKAGSKLSKAEKLGVQIVNEEELTSILGQISL